MDSNDYNFLKKLLEAQNISLNIFNNEVEFGEKFDKSLRKNLYQKFDYLKMKDKIMKVCKKNVLYSVSDVFDVNYTIMVSEQNSYLDKDYGETIIVIGPYISSESKPDAKKIILENNLELFHESLFKTYYNTLPYGINTDQMVCSFFKYILNDENLIVKNIDLEFDELIYPFVYQLNKIDNNGIKEMEERYLLEEKLLDAIRIGDKKRANSILNAMNIKLDNKYIDSDFARTKDIVLTTNVLFRKTVQQVRVHPVHIDAISQEFIQRIRLCNDEFELSVVFSEMVNVYCKIARKHSMSNYSGLIEDVVNYIEFNLNEELSLNRVAIKFSINASYLSSKFKKEIGESFTSYVNSKRIQKSQYLLLSTKLSVQEIAELVGILDENYFSRIFKKYANITPQKYRNQQKNK